MQIPFSFLILFDENASPEFDWYGIHILFLTVAIFEFQYQPFACIVKK